MDISNDINYNIDNNDNHIIKSYELTESVNQFMLKNGLIISKLETMITELSGHRMGCNVAKTVGTSVSGLGSIAMATSLVLTPFTLGMSSVVLIGGGVATAVGTLTNIGTDLANNIITKKFLHQIKSLAEERNECAFDLSQKFEEFNSIINNNIKKKLNKNLMNDNYEEVRDFVQIMKMMANGSLSLYKVGNNSIKLFDAIKEMNALKAAKAVKTSSDLGKNVAKSVITLIPAETKGMSSLIRSTGPAVGKNALKGVSAVAGLAFTAIDVVNLVQDWNKSHPTIDVINNLIEELKSDANLVQSIYNIITIDEMDQQLINDIINIIQTNNSINNFENENEPQVSVNLNDCQVLYKSNAKVD